MKRMHLKKRGNIKIKLSNKIIIIIIMIIIGIVYLFKIFNDKALPLFIKYSEVETKKIAAFLLNSAITEEVTNNYDMDELFITTNDADGNITSIDFNSVMVNKILTSASKVAELNLKYLEEGKVDLLTSSIPSNNYKKLKNGIVFELPSGIILNNTILNNLLPKIPVKLEPVGSIFSRINTEVKAYGINNSLIEVYISITVNLRILMPFTSSTTEITTKIPLAIKVIQGKIPSYYLNGYLDTPSLTTNIE